MEFHTIHQNWISKGIYSLDILEVFWDNSNWKGLQEVYYPTSGSKQRQFWAQTWFWGLYLDWFWNPTRTDCKTSLDNLLHCSPVLMYKKFYCTQSETILFQFKPIASCFPNRYCCEKPASSSYNLLVGTGRRLLSLSPGWTSSVPSASSHRANAPARPAQLLCAKLALVWLCISCIEWPKMGWCVLSAE